jgi:hypothetical protein
MQGIAQKVMMAPERYSVDMLRRAIETGLLPAYIGVPLIQAKMQSQQQMQQSAALGRPSPDQQPTVAQQIMGQSGVEALPSNLPQEYAAGGIVAFDRGGEVERFQEGGTSLFAPDRYSAMQRNAAERAERERREREAYEQATQFNVPTRRQAGVIERQAALTAARESEAPQGFRGQGLLGMLGIPLGGARSPEMAEAIRQERESTAAAPTAPPVTAPPAPRPRGLSGAPRAAAPAQGIEALPAALTAPTLGMPSGPSNLRLAEDAVANMRGVAEMEEQYANQRMQDLRSQLTGKPFEAYKQRIETEARQAGADRADAKNLALIKAGLAMMAGTSRHALTNIGQGAMVGVADWQAAAKDFKTAERERNKELSLIEQAERAEQRGDVKEQMGLLSAARDRRTAQNSALTKMMLDANFADNQAEAKRLADQFGADAAAHRLGQQLRAEQQMATERNRTTLEAAGIGAAATLGASQNRARDPNAIPPGVQTAMYQQRIALQEPARAFALKQLGLKTEPPIPGPNAGPLDPAVLNYTQYRDLVNRYIESNIPAPQGRAAPQTPAPAVPDPFVGYERLR